MRLRRNRSAAEPEAEDYGLLVAAATVPSDDAARTVRNILRANGIRSTTGPAFRHPQRHHRRILVFAEDAARAYQVICAHTG
ncbi:hypothetical protein [Nocardia wallacei]|uniref:hypothetical protein n=1 Tax=Nocardia wallacei TaxID=480035 RepID=UPI0024568EFF|nr:hypothetical protein [Nocardia wallacei]